MNYYEHHLGDYAAATAHLSWDEDMAYQRLIRAYYHHEKPIPSDLKAACRLVRATSAAQRQAVETVLQEFFEPSPDGWRQKRCDAEIACYQEKQEKARRSANARWSAVQPQCERNANASAGKHANALPAQSEGNAPRHQTPDTTIEAELHGGEASAKPPRATRKCPDDFVVTEAMADWAKRECPSVPLTRETAAFRDHTFKTSISDWPGAWRNWIRRSSQFAPGAAKTTARQAEVAKWLGPLAQQPRQGEIIDMEDGHGPRIAMG